MLKRILRLDGWVLTVFEWPGDKAILHYSWPQGERGLGVGYWVVMGFWDLAAGQRWHTQLGEARRDCHHFACLRFMRAALERKCFNQPCLPSMSITLTAIYLRHHRIKSCVLCAPHTHTPTDISFSNTYLIHSDQQSYCFMYFGCCPAEVQSCQGSPYLMLCSVAKWKKPFRKYINTDVNT